MNFPRFTDEIEFSTSIQCTLWEPINAVEYLNAIYPPDPGRAFRLSYGRGGGGVANQPLAYGTAPAVANPLALGFDVSPPTRVERGLHAARTSVTGRVSCYQNGLWDPTTIQSPPSIGLRASTLDHRMMTHSNPPKKRKQIFFTALFFFWGNLLIEEWKSEWIRETIYQRQENEIMWKRKKN